MTHLNQQPPILLSICIPTFNRQDLLAHTLDQLKWILDTGLAIEIVISDNASEDETERVAIEKGRMFPHFRYVRQSINMGSEHNFFAAPRFARGKFFIHLSDDDRLIPDILLAEVDYLNKNDDTVMSYAPWRVWNDVTSEDHGLFYRHEEPIDFTKQQSVDMYNFITSKRIYPEIAIYRTEISTKFFIKHSVYSGFIHCFKALEYGKVRFQPNPFYINIMQTHIKARNDQKEGVKQVLTFLDKYRGGLELGTSLALSNIGMSSLNPGNRSAILDLINHFIMERVETVSRITKHQQNFIAAAEYSKRLLLWAKTTDEKERIRGMETEIVSGAAFQAMGELFDVMVGAKHLVLCEMTNSNDIQAKFRYFVPRMPTVIMDLPTTLNAADRHDCLYLVDQDAVRLAIQAIGIECGKIVAISELSHMFRITS